MLHFYIPTLAEFKALAAIKGDTCVSLYVPTSPLPDHAREDRIALEDLVKGALSQLREAGTDKRRIASLEEQFRYRSRQVLRKDSRWLARQAALYLTNGLGP